MGHSSNLIQWELVLCWFCHLVILLSWHHASNLKQDILHVGLQKIDIHTLVFSIAFLFAFMWWLVASGLTGKEKYLVPCLVQVQQKCQHWCDKAVSSGPTIESKYFIGPLQTTQGYVKLFHLTAVNYEAAPRFSETLGEIWECLPKCIL